jgi:hypothetical protein
LRPPIWSDEERTRPGVEPVDGVLLDEQPFGQHRDLVGERGGLVQVMGDQHDGGLQGLADLSHEVVHLLAQGCVEGAERFVEHQDPRLGREGASDGDPLLLATGQVRRAAMTEVGKLHQVEVLASLRARLPARGAPDACGERDVVEDVAVRKQEGALEDHGHPPMLGRDVEDTTPVEQDVTGVGAVEPAGKAEHGGLPRTRGTEKGETGPGRHGQVESGQRGRRGAGIAAGEPPQCQLCAHGAPWAVARGWPAPAAP